MSDVRFVPNDPAAEALGCALADAGVWDSHDPEGLREALDLLIGRGWMLATVCTGCGGTGDAVNCCPGAVEDCPKCGGTGALRARMLTY